MGAGSGIDIYGGPVIDPTENVLSLVDVEKEHARQLRASDAELARVRFEGESKYQDGQRIAEKEKQQALADLKSGYDKQISDILTVQVKTTSELISTQLDKVTTSLSVQIGTAAQQQLGLMNTLSERIGRLEQSRWEVAGRSSVADPALSDALARLTANMASTKIDQEASLAKLTTAVATMQTSESSSAGQRRGMTDTNARMLAVVMAISSIATPIVAVVAVLVATHMGH